MEKRLYRPRVQNDKVTARTVNKRKRIRNWDKKERRDGIRDDSERWREMDQR